MWRILKLAWQGLQFAVGMLVALPFFLVLFGGGLAIVGALSGSDVALAWGKSVCGLGGLGVAALLFTPIGEGLMRAFSAFSLSATDDPSGPVTNAPRGQARWLKTRTPIVDEGKASAAARMEVLRRFLEQHKRGLRAQVDEPKDK
jgi:hypothetical protein